MRPQRSAADHSRFRLRWSKAAVASMRPQRSAADHRIGSARRVTAIPRGFNEAAAFCCGSRQGFGCGLAVAPELQ